MRVTTTSTGEHPIVVPEAAIGVDESSPAGGGFRTLLRLRNFRLLWLGQTISVLGDQFYFIALPWLVLQVTGSALTMGVVLALEGVPRALFMLLGGALTDRFSPRVVMLWSNIARMVLVLALGMLVLANAVQVWMFYAFALVFGVADAFYGPASSSMVPSLVPEKWLQSGNAIIQGTFQITSVIGPALAGGLIAAMSGVDASAITAEAADAIQTVDTGNMAGIGLAFLLDAATFIASAVTLVMLRLERAAQAEEGQSVIAAIREGLAYVVHDQTIRGYFILIGAANVLISAPIAVGIPVLADARLEGGAAAYGFIMSVLGGGSLVGLLLAGTLPRPPARIMGMVLGTVWSVMGFGIALIGQMHVTAAIAAVALVMGIANGYVGILFITWLQSRTPSVILGRVMSVYMFATIGLIPVGNAVFGAFVDLNMRAVFGISGLTMAGMVFLAMFNPNMRAMPWGVMDQTE